MGTNWDLGRDKTHKHGPLCLKYIIGPYLVKWVYNLQNGTSYAIAESPSQNLSLWLYYGFYSLWLSSLLPHTFSSYLLNDPTLSLTLSSFLLFSFLINTLSSFLSTLIDNPHIDGNGLASIHIYICQLY